MVVVENIIAHLIGREASAHAVLIGLIVITLGLYVVINVLLERRRG